MNLSTILCPLDFSAASSGLVAYAAALAVATGAHLRLLHVHEPQETDTDLTSAACTEQLASLRGEAEQAGAMWVSSEVLRGQAAAEIVTDANQRAASLIVIGAHGRTGLTRFLMGSTAETVLRTAACPTLLVRQPLPEAA